MPVTPALLALLALSAAPGAAPRALVPLPAGQWISTHGPYEMGACNACHDPSDPQAPPGRIRKPGNALCFDCHDDYQKPIKGHPSPDDPCLTCHSPHNAKKKKLLLR